MGSCSSGCPVRAALCFIAMDAACSIGHGVAGTNGLFMGARRWKERFVVSLSAKLHRVAR